MRLLEDCIFGKFCAHGNFVLTDTWQYIDFTDFYFLILLVSSLLSNYILQRTQRENLSLSSGERLRISGRATRRKSFANASNDEYFLGQAKGK